MTRFGQMYLGVMLSCPGATIIEDETLLRAIAQVETGTVILSRPCRKVGKAGERGAWQMKWMVWRQYTREPFAKASSNPTLAHLIARLHLENIRLSIKKAGMEATPFQIAYRWNSGPQAMDYAERVNNLYGAIKEFR